MTSPGSGNGGNDDGARRRQNLIAIAVLVVLLIGGIWLFTAIRNYLAIEQCIETGRRDCVPIDK